MFVSLLLTIGMTDFLIDRPDLSEKPLQARYFRKLVYFARVILDIEECFFINV